ncbi:MAG: DUF5060 domain-containing protein, partial [Flavitalea sp.]
FMSMKFLKNLFIHLVLLCFYFPLFSKGQVTQSALPAQGDTGKLEAEKAAAAALKFTDPLIRMPDGDGKVEMAGEMKLWHKLTLTMNGPFAHELDREPNPFTDYRMTVRFIHESGNPVFEVPGYFAADGNAGETGADNGIKWRCHFSPEKTGRWTYEVSFLKGEMIAIVDIPWANKLSTYDGIKGEFTISQTDKTGKDFRSKGRLDYVGKNHLQFKGTGEYFLKAGTDSPETLFGYKEFDGTYTIFSETWKLKVPLKSFEAHIADWKEGDPTWQNGKGKGLIGVVNYLSNKGLNSFSFLTYNAGGDGNNVWPFIKRNEKYNYDCSKLDQWQVVFDHAQTKGLHLHFKTQETEIDDNTTSTKDKVVIESLDGGDLGPQRRLYYRELIARFGYLLALNWNLGEENTQTTQQQKDMAAYFEKMDPYKHNIVLHTYPDQQDKVYNALLGNNSKLTGLSLQNAWSAVHKQTLNWVNESNKTGRPWVVANDEQSPSLLGVPPDPGFGNYAPNKGYDLHDIRKQVLWGNIMAGGAGVEYYFGDTPPENDMLSENFRSRDKSWDYCKNALDFFKQNKLPFWEMENRNKLINNMDDNKDKFCLAKEGELYLVYLGYSSTTTLDLTDADGTFTIKWFNPREGGKLLSGKVKKIKAGKIVNLGAPPATANEDWVILVQKG